MKLGSIGIALACALYCATLLEFAQPQEKNSNVVFGNEDKHIHIEMIQIIPGDFLVDEMRVLLWPEADLELKNKPFDMWYYPLSQAQIDDLLHFYKMRREFFPYVVDAWDCDDFSEEFTYLSRVWSMRRFLPLFPGPTDWLDAPPVPAVGCAFVRINGLYELFTQPAWGRAAHAINVILRDDGQWFFVEPQTLKMQKIEGPRYEGVIEPVRIQI